MKTTLTTERLTLRPLRVTDAADYAAYIGKEDLARMTGSVPYPFPEMSAEFWIINKLAKARRGLCHPYVLCFDDGKMFGLVDLFKRSEDGPLEIGYSMAEQHWGKGYMYEACEAVIAEARESLGATRIIAGVFADNPASIRLLVKLGFSAQDTQEQWFSMARMEKARGVVLSLDLTKTPRLEAAE